MRVTLHFSDTGFWVTISRWEKELAIASYLNVDTIDSCTRNIALQEKRQAECNNSQRCNRQTADR